METNRRADGVLIFYPKALPEWRQWLEENHATEKSVWLIFFKKNTGKPSLKIGEAIDEALCFGWVDSKVNKRDEESYFQYFAKRNPKSNWSRVNKQKIERLMKEGRMAPAGLDMVEHAKKMGTWSALDDVENGVIPKDLEQAFENFPGSKEHFEAFPRSARRAILEWILNAKRQGTRKKRIEETARLAAENIRANEWRPGKD